MLCWTHRFIMRVIALIALALFANAQLTLTTSSSSSPSPTYSSSRSSIATRSSSFTPTSSASSTLSKSSQPSKSSTASSTLSKSSLPSKSSSASPNTTISSRWSKTSTASPSFSKSPKPSVLFNSISGSYTALPATTTTPLSSASFSPSAKPSYSANATLSVTPSTTSTSSVTRTKFCPNWVDPLKLDPDGYCNGKPVETINFAGFILYGLIYAGYCLTAMCFFAFTTLCHPCSNYYDNKCGDFAMCITVTTILFPPFIVFPILFYGWSFLRHCSIQVYKCCFPPPPPPFPKKCFPDPQCPVCISTKEDYVCLPCGHFICKTCITTLQIGKPPGPDGPGRNPNFDCPKCRSPYSPDATRSCTYVQMLVLIANQTRATAASQAETGATIEVRVV